MKVMKSTIRLFVYLGVVGVFICLVLWKQNVIRIKRAKKIVSSIDECVQNGKPVKVEEVKLQDVKVYTKITLFHTSNNTCEGFVPKAVKEKLNVGQIGYSVIGENKKIEGRIIEISDEADLDNGMFLIKVKIAQEISTTNAKVIANVHTNTYKNVINIVNEAVDIVEGKYYIWKVANGLAKRQKIQIDKQNGYGTIVTKGLKVQDLIIVEGQSLLKENEKVLIISCNSCNQGSPKGTSK